MLQNLQKLFVMSQREPVSSSRFTLETHFSTKLGAGCKHRAKYSACWRSVVFGGEWITARLLHWRPRMKNISHRVWCGCGGGALCFGPDLIDSIFNAVFRSLCFFCVVLTNLFDPTIIINTSDGFTAFIPNFIVCLQFETVKLSNMPLFEIV